MLHGTSASTSPFATVHSRSCLAQKAEAASESEPARSKVEVRKGETIGFAQAKVRCLPLLFLAVHLSEDPLRQLFYAIDRSRQDARKYWLLLPVGCCIASSPPIDGEIIGRAYESRDRSPQLLQRRCQCHHALVSLRPTITCLHMTPPKPMTSHHSRSTKSLLFACFHGRP